MKSPTCPDRAARPAPGTPEPAARRQVVLVVSCLALMMVISAVSGLNVALSSLARETGATDTQLQWIIDAYTLTFAGLLLPFGNAGDRFGRKLMLAGGTVVFGAAMLLAAASHDPGLLLAARAVAGVGAAGVMPTTLAIITSVFPPAERGRAVGVWAGVAGGSALAGLLVSGALLQAFTVSSIFIFNAVLAAVVVAATLAVVPRTGRRPGAPLDPAGTLLSAGGLAAIVFATIEGPGQGWTSALTLAAFAAGVLALAGFVAWELRLRRPLLDPRLFARRGFGTGSLSLTLQFFAAFGFFFIASQYLQFVHGYSALKTAVAALPMGVLVVAVAPRAPRLAGRLGIRLVAGGGLTAMAAGLALLAFLGTRSPYWQFAVGICIFGTGMGLATAPSTTAIVTSLPDDQQGIASAVNDVTREVGGALGIAVLGSLLAGGYRTQITPRTGQLPPALASKAQQSIAFAQQVAAPHLGTRGPQFAHAAASAFVHGLSIALLTGAAVLAAGAVAVFARAPRK